MHAFIVRPFGEKKGIDFDRVESELIMPALRALGFSGGTTALFLEQGNIRTDMFYELLIADLVIADISIHNANVFYELGIRQALRKRHTFLLRSSTPDEVPFDLKTDRYLHYDASAPAASLQTLTEALRETWIAKKTDSPVFQLLPHLQDVFSEPFNLVPLDFQEALRHAVSEGDTVLLELMGAELHGIPWKCAGLRLIGEAQTSLNAWRDARITWNAVLEYDKFDVEANSELATIYDRLGESCLADQAVDRALQGGERMLPDARRAELLALRGRNAKTRWHSAWAGIANTAEKQQTALSSIHIRESYEWYSKGFAVDRNHYYPGLNALAMLTIMIELAGLHPSTWESQYQTSREAAFMLDGYRENLRLLAAGVRLALDSQRERAKNGERDIWLEISEADHAFLTLDNTVFICQKYRQLLSCLAPFYRDSAMRQIGLFRELSLFSDRTGAVQHAVPSSPSESEKPAVQVRALLFTGHRLDAPGRGTPRFPASGEDAAREMIRAAVTRELEHAGEWTLAGIAGAASGGDIIFLEICEELGIPLHIHLAVPERDYIRASVADGGHEWVERFETLVRKHAPKVLCRDGQLPAWLRGRKDYNIWQRSNLWMLFSAFTLSPDSLTLVALWDGAPGDAPGGTADMVSRARDLGARIVHLDTRKLIAGGSSV